MKSKLIVFAILISGLYLSGPSADASSQIMQDWQATSEKLARNYQLELDNEVELYTAIKQELDFEEYFHGETVVIDQLNKLGHAVTKQLMEDLIDYKNKAVLLLNAIEGENISKIVAFNQFFMSEVIGSSEYSYDKPKLFQAVEEYAPISNKYIDLEKMLWPRPQYTSNDYFNLLTQNFGW